MFKTIKYKYLTLDELIINLDRLSRFKNPEESFPRVFYSIIFKCLVTPKYSKIEIEKLDSIYVSKLVKKIWNESIKNLFSIEKDSETNFLKLLISTSFKNLDERTNTFINTKLRTYELLKNLDDDKIPYNLLFLKKAAEHKIKDINDLVELRQKYSLKFPIKKLLIVEGITEEILLPVFAKKLNLNFEKEGIYILSAGGKSKSPSLYLKLKDKLKIPIVLLFDADATEINNLLKKELRNIDSTIIIKQGEFEDILSLNLIKRSLNNEYQPATELTISELKSHNKMCDNLENFYRTRHLGEFKKSKLSKIIAQNIKYNTDITEEIKNIILSLV